MRIPEHLHSSLIEQLEDQASSDDFLIMRGTALGYGLLGNDSKRDEFIQKFLQVLNLTWDIRKCLELWDLTQHL